MMNVVIEDKHEGVVLDFSNPSKKCCFLYSFWLVEKWTSAPFFKFAAPFAGLWVRYLRSLSCKDHFFVKDWCLPSPFVDLHVCLIFYTSSFSDKNQGKMLLLEISSYQFHLKPNQTRGRISEEIFTGGGGGKMKKRSRKTFQKKINQNEPRVGKRGSKPVAAATTKRQSWIGGI